MLMLFVSSTIQAQTKDEIYLAYEVDTMYDGEVKVDNFKTGNLYVAVFQKNGILYFEKDTHTGPSHLLKAVLTQYNYKDFYEGKNRVKAYYYYFDTKVEGTVIRMFGNLYIVTLSDSSQRYSFRVDFNKNSSLTYIGSVEISETLDIK